MPLSNRAYHGIFGILTVLLQATVFSTPVCAAQQVSFNLDVFPIIKSRCVKCHGPGGPGYEASGLDLRSYDGLMKGTKLGRVVVPGDPLSSTMMVLIEGRANPSIRMPHNERPLLKPQIEILRDWVSQGAKDN